MFLTSVPFLNQKSSLKCILRKMVDDYLFNLQREYQRLICDCRSDTSSHNIIFAMKMSYITLIANHSEMRDNKLFA